MRHVFLNCMFRILCFYVTCLCVVWRVSLVVFALVYVSSVCRMFLNFIVCVLCCFVCPESVRYVAGIMYVL